MFAIIETGGKQYKVTEQDIIFVEKLEAEVGAEITLNNVKFLSNGDKVEIGAPIVEGVSVKAKVLGQGKDKKIYVMTYKSKKNEKKKIGHRQPYTKLQILSIG